MMIDRSKLWFMVGAMLTLISTSALAQLDFEALPSPPAYSTATVDSSGAPRVAFPEVFFGEQNGFLIAADASGIRVLPFGASGSEAWQRVGELSLSRDGGAVVSDGTGLICIGGVGEGGATDQVTRLVWDSEAETFAEEELASLPRVLASGSAARIDQTIYVTDGTEVWSLDLGAADSSWAVLPSPGVALDDAVLAVRQGWVYLFGREDDLPKALRLNLVEATASWDVREAPATLESPAFAVPMGLSHLLIASGDRFMAYHTAIDRWVDFGPVDPDVGVVRGLSEIDGGIVVLGSSGAARLRPTPLETNYGLIDNLVVGAYLLGMVGIGWYFSRRESSTSDFFRGGQRIPWWAAGMSLFATGASAISLAGMPGMGFGTDWTYFTISVCTVMALPITVFVMAPLVRRLKISTSNEYLERRFGLTARLFASSIFMFTQVASRIASVMLLSAIALEAITDLDILTAIVVMGVVTTVYTYLGGLEAVIWTDTVQGFVMIATVIGCLVLALVKVGQPPDQMWMAVQDYDKLHSLDFSNSLIYPTAFIFFVHTIFLTFGGISDQNFVQRVQSTPDMRQTRMAVVAQMAVAIPINVLLFSLGTALWLFYRQQPEMLSPTIKNNDGVFPFFAAQQLPIGVSGLVVAALLAATMSTVSSSICAVSDLGTNDFYRRFNRRATDHQCLVLGRILTGVIGVLGTCAAMVLASIEDVKSVWDLAILVTGLISSSVIGLFTVGLVTRRTHQTGAMIGAFAAIATIVWMKYNSPITFWLYIVIGPIITVVVGFLASLVIPGKRRDINGLTLFTLKAASAAASEPAAE